MSQLRTIHSDLERNPVFPERYLRRRAVLRPEAPFDATTKFHREISDDENTLEHCEMALEHKTFILYWLK